MSRFMAWLRALSGGQVCPEGRIYDTLRYDTDRYLCDIKVCTYACMCVCGAGDGGAG